MTIGGGRAGRPKHSAPTALRFNGLTLQRFNAISAAESALALAADELLDATIGLVVGHLDRRMFLEKRGRGMQHAADTPVETEFAAANRVNGDSG